MARYLLIEFDDDKQAESLMRKVQGWSAQGAAMRVRGLFAAPTKFCECPPIPESRFKDEITRGAKYGWTVHRVCRRARYMGQLPTNLIESDLPTPEKTAFLHLAPTTAPILVKP